MRFALLGGAMAFFNRPVDLGKKNLGPLMQCFFIGRQIQQAERVLVQPGQPQRPHAEGNRLPPQCLRRPHAVARSRLQARAQRRHIALRQRDWFWLHNGMLGSAGRRGKLYRSGKH